MSHPFFEPLRNMSDAKAKFEKRMAELYGCKYVNGQCTIHGSIRVEQKPKRKRGPTIVGPSYTVMPRTGKML